MATANGGARLSNPVVFSRQESNFVPATGGKNEGGRDPGPDPRSPGDVPRTPSLGNGRKSSKGGGVMKAAALNAQSGNGGKGPVVVQPPTPTQNNNDPNSPLNKIVHQTSDVGQTAPLATASQPQATGGSGGIFGMLCCCLVPASQPQATGRGGGGGGGSSGGSSGSTGSTEIGSAYGKGSSKPSTPGKPILPPMSAEHTGRKCLVLDLDETLAHSSFRAVPNPDYVIPVRIEDQVHHVYVCKRPGVDDFLKRAGEHFEIVIYTASLNKYADPLLDKLDIHKVISHRLFRESCTHYQGNYVKNLSLLGRDLSQTIIVDNSPLSYLFHPDNAIGCISWIDQKDDTELQVIEDFLELTINVDDVRHHLRNWRQGANYRIPPGSISKS